MFLLLKYTLLYTVVLMMVALGGMFSERSGVVNIALEGIMTMGAFTGILFLNMTGGRMSGQTQLFLAIHAPFEVTLLAELKFSLE